MTTVLLEVVDDDEIDCDYYGLAYITHMIHMTKKDGDIQTVLADLQKKFAKAYQAVYQSNQITGQMQQVNQHIKDLKAKITTSNRKLARARRAVASVDPTKVVELKDSSLAINNKRLHELKDKAAQLDKQYAELSAIRDQNTEEDDVFESILNDLTSAGVKIKTITLQTVLNTVLGSTALYDALLDDGWVVEDPFKHSLNEISDENGCNHNELYTTQRQFRVYNSKH